MFPVFCVKRCVQIGISLPSVSLPSYKFLPFFTRKYYGQFFSCTKQWSTANVYVNKISIKSSCRRGRKLFTTTEEDLTVQEPEWQTSLYSSGFNMPSLSSSSRGSCREMIQNTRTSPTNQTCFPIEKDQSVLKEKQLTTSVSYRHLFVLQVLPILDAVVDGQENVTDALFVRLVEG